ncbi:acyl-CoA synthetase [Sphingomonas sp. MG17]|uniref:Acyl-CoA synthetase n=1 Tax=Sphingomonas tagetis TaxID=2949092 RepID=A0A9X2KLD2_9SPHN|nr:acyl-CoA synthetase [Sphingomonas tagetis]MCP3730301.1 acyl-CoA synthetase [Sphingomonas tagetis]
MFLGNWADKTPNKPAMIFASNGQVVTYRELDDRSMQLAQLFHARGLRVGDRVALFMENNPRFMEVVWAALRSGLEIVPVNRFALLDEVSYIVNDSGAKAFVTSSARADVARDVPPATPQCHVLLMCDGTVDGFDAYEAAIAAQPVAPLGEAWAGSIMPYTSGTTGRPKGVYRKPPQGQLISEQWATTTLFEQEYGFGPDMVYLSPAPLYHGAPIRFARAIHSVGGTLIVMEKFDERRALELIERYRVTHSQWVPTMFVRMLRLPREVREAFDVSSLRFAVHAAAPCPVDIKREMIEWWGPIIYEYYGATDGCVDTQISSEEWLRHPGSVGKPAPGMKICDDSGEPVPDGEEGFIYAEWNCDIAYLNDPVKTASAHNPKYYNLWTVGDIGYVKDGYLYLSGRRGFTIISGGVNIYPQAVEDAIINCEMVRDVAVIGVPNALMGEEVKAVVELMPGVAASPETEAAIIAYTRSKIAAYMAPRSVDFVDALPRLPTGKLYKQGLIDKYRAK